MNANLITVDTLATAAELSVAQLFTFARHIESYFYPTRKQRGRNGKVREIDAPKPAAKRILRRIHNVLQNLLSPHGISHGAVPKRSPFTSAHRHLGRNHVITRDIHKCFPSIKTEALRSELLKLRFRSDVAWLLSRLFTVHGRVPQGSPLSNDALNLFLYSADEIISARAGLLGAKASRYCDDIVISADDSAAVPAIEALIEAQIEAKGLSVNSKKRDERGLQSSNKIQLVHGLVVNSRRGSAINPEQARESRETAERYIRAAHSVDTFSIESVANLRRRVTGLMYHCRQAGTSPAAYIRSCLEAGDRHVRRYLIKNGLRTHTKTWHTYKRAADVAAQLQQRRYSP